jgi:ATP synthase protein I
MKTLAGASENEAVDTDDYKPQSAEQARRLREIQPPVSPRGVVGVQALVGLVLAVGLALFTGRIELGWSAGYGALAVVIPAAVFARGLRSRLSSVNAGAAALGFLLWEMVKLALTMAMLFAAPRLVPGLNWLALLAGLVLALKVYWVALAVRPRIRRVDEQDE